MNRIFCFYFHRHFRISTNLRRFANQDLSPTADLAPRQPDWGMDSKPRPSSDALTNDYDRGSRQSYPGDFADQRYDRVQSGYIVEGYPEGVVMRKKPDDRPFYPYHPQRNGYDARDGYVANGNIAARAAAAPPGAFVSGRPQDLYAKVIKPSERDQNVTPRQPYDVDSGGRPSFERGHEGSVSSGASFALRPDGRRVDDGWAAAASPLQQKPQPSRDLNHNINKSYITDSPGRPASQPRVYRPGERHIDGTPMFGDPSKNGSRRQAMSSSTDRPSHLPLPTSMRGQYIDELAATKTPHSQQDLMQAKALSQQRYGQPSYFQYPERDTARLVSFSSLLLLLFSPSVL